VNEWREVLNQVRMMNEALQDRRAIDMRPAWRALGYREAAGEPEPVVWAEAAGAQGDFVVRVSGFSQYFVALDREVQNDVIRGRAHA